MGRTDGEEAVYQMLSWSEGTFSTNEQAAAPRHTIKDELGFSIARKVSTGLTNTNER